MEEEKVEVADKQKELQDQLRGLDEEKKEKEATLKQASK